MWASRAEVNGRDELLLEAEGGAVGPPSHPATAPDDEKKAAPCNTPLVPETPRDQVSITHSAGEETEAGVSECRTTLETKPQSHGGPCHCLRG